MNRLKNSAVSLVIIAFLFLLAACTGKIDDKNSSLDISGAYFLVFEQLFNTDMALNYEMKYISLDLTNSLLEDKEELIGLMEKFCDDNNYILMQDTIEGLIDKGYVKDNYFEEGIVIKFGDETLEDKKLVTSASKWRSGLGAIGARYTITTEDEAWKVYEVSEQWIS